MYKTYIALRIGLETSINIPPCCICTLWNGSALFWYIFSVTGFRMCRNRDKLKRQKDPSPYIITFTCIKQGHSVSVIYMHD